MSLLPVAAGRNRESPARSPLAHVFRFRRCGIRGHRARVVSSRLLPTLLASLAIMTSAAPAAGADPGVRPRTVPMAATARPAAPPPVIAGELTWRADAPHFTDCATGRSHPVAQEGDWPRAERAWRAAAKTPDATLYVSFEGSLEERPGIQADSSEATIVVRRFIHAWPGETCERARADARFANTYWRIVALGAEDLAPAAGRREPQLRIRAARDDAAVGDYSASVGCNTINGRFELTGTALRFAPGAATRMACPPPLDALERRLLDTLTRTASLRIHANTLELFDARGASLGLLQAVYL